MRARHDLFIRRNQPRKQNEKIGRWIIHVKEDPNPRSGTLFCNGDFPRGLLVRQRHGSGSEHGGPRGSRGTADEAPAETPAETAGLKFGWSVYDNQQEFFQSMTAGVEEKAAEMGIQVILHDQQNDETEMVSGATRLINDEGVDALVISPCKPEALSSIVELAKQKSIPVIICDIGDGGTDKDAIIVSDMYGGGRMAGKYALSCLKRRAPPARTTPSSAARLPRSTPRAAPRASRTS